MLTSGSAGGDDFQELFEDAFNWEDIPRKIQAESIDASKGNAGTENIERHGSTVATCQPRLLRIKTMSFMLSLFKSYALFMSNPAGNVVSVKNGIDTATTVDSTNSGSAETGTSEISVRERIQKIQAKQSHFNLAGFLASCLPEDAPFLERFVGYAESRMVDSKDLDLRSNRENGTQTWSLFLHER